jgi:hypothetical protein
MTTRRLIVLLVALAMGIASAGCGDDEGSPIPAATATELNAELDGVQARIDNGSAGACRDILEGSRGPNLERVNELIDGMPDDVDPDVRSALEESFDRLWELVQQDCDDKAQQEEESQPEPETETETTPPETETEETTPTETTETTPPEQEPLPPEGDGDNDGGVPGNGNGNGNGVGNGGGVGPGGADLGGG